MSKQNKANVWCSEDYPLKYNPNVYYLVNAIEDGEVGLRRISFDHKNIANRIDEEKLTEIDKEEKITKWKRKCGNKSCCHGIEKLVKNGSEFADATGNREAIDENIAGIAQVSGERVLIEGGHYIPDLRDFSHAAVQPYLALEEALKIAEIAYNAGKKPDILIFVNDLHTGQSHGRENREIYWRDYALPDNMKELIRQYQTRFDFNVIVAGERKLSDKLQRDRKRLLREGNLEHEVREGADDYYVEIDGERQLLISHTHYDPSKKEECASEDKNKISGGYLKCIAACTRVIEMAKEMGYTNLIQVYPICATGSVETAVKMHQKLYDGGIDVTNIYRTVTCFVDTYNIKGIAPKQ